MTQIISISLNEDILKDIDDIQKKLGFSGRSEVVRTSVRSLIQEEKRFEGKKGKTEGVLIVLHDEKHTNEFSELKHQFHNIVKTHIHHEIKEHNCLEILLFEGKYSDVKKLNDVFLSSNKMTMVKMIIPS